MNITKATLADLDSIQEVFSFARNQMRQNGNPSQWGQNRPLTESIIKDIKMNNFYLMKDGNELVGVFAFIVGEDPTYKVIEDGAWPNNNPYGTIHKIAGNGKAGGIFHQCLEFCMEIIDTIRIDTHRDNHIMQNLLEKEGFMRCGIIYVDDGTERIAYQKG